MVILAPPPPAPEAALWLAPREREGEPPFVRVYADASMGCRAPAEEPMDCPPAMGMAGDFAEGGGGGGGGLEAVKEGRVGGADGGGGGGGGAGLAGGEA